LPSAAAARARHAGLKRGESTAIGSQPKASGQGNGNPLQQPMVAGGGSAQQQQHAESTLK
jgi:hypothetical protein